MNGKVINIIVLALLVLTPVGVAGLMYQSPPPAKTHIANEIPDIDFIARNGKTYNLRQFGERYVIVNLWASWCAPCVAEFPHLIGLAERNKDRLTLVALSSDFGVPEMEQFLSRLDMKIPSNMLIAHDPEGKITRDTFKTYQLPETFLYGPDGDLWKKIIGAEWSVQEVEALLR